MKKKSKPKKNPFTNKKSSYKLRAPMKASSINAGAYRSKKSRAVTV